MVVRTAYRSYGAQTRRLSTARVGLLALLMVGCSEPPAFVDNHEQSAEFPAQYRGWRDTLKDEQREDLLAQRPALVVLWAGSAYAKEFHSPRGHQFAAADVAHTLRTGQPATNSTPSDSLPLSASCWTCKSPDTARMIQQLGQAEFASLSFHQVGAEVKNSIGCSDCHDPASQALRLARPQALHAMYLIHQPFEQQTPKLQGAQTCGQCHVTYYFRSDDHNRVFMPWFYGSRVEQMERYYDDRRFYEWIHPISQAPMLKARHPEYETWSRSRHAQVGVTCITCHMPKRQSDEGVHYHEHRILSRSDDLKAVCHQCHGEKGTQWEHIQKEKMAIARQRDEVEALLVKAHYEAGALWQAGAQWSQMDPALMAIRHSQWRWDFAVASHGLFAHNPSEARVVLASAKNLVIHARRLLAALMNEFSIEQVAYPDLSSKKTAQQAVGLDMTAIKREKAEYIRQEIDRHWSDVSRAGY